MNFVCERRVIFQDVLNTQLKDVPHAPSLDMVFGAGQRFFETFSDVYVGVDGPIATVHFQSLHNGALGTRVVHRLREAFLKAKQQVRSDCSLNVP